MTTRPVCSRKIFFLHTHICTQAIGLFTIALGKKTGTTFPITFDNKHNPRYMPLTIFNLSTVDHLYIGKDTVITFAEQPVLETYNIELASEDKIKEHLAKPRN